MKQTSSKNGERRSSVVMTASKQSCGTLSYLAECRGASRKADAIAHKNPTADLMAGTSGKYSAVR
jgi:hypothetical protein